MLSDWDKEREAMQKRISDLEAELERERKLFHVARIMRLRKVDDPDAHAQKLLKLGIEQLDELASITEETLEVRAISHGGRTHPGVG